MTWSWFDIFTAVALLAGVWRGKKRGMSEELLDLMKWLSIIVLGGLCYKPLGQFLSAYTKMPLMWAYITAYVVVFAVLQFLFGALKRAVGEKLMHADAFGKLEYYLGMLAGALRFACVLLMAMALLHAIYISDAERAATAKMQAENYGTITFPTIGSLQQDVFFASETGRFAVRYLNDQLIEAAPPGKVVRRKTALDEVLKQ
jgi:uncharacterized membrane protein required for colicin V production